MAEESINMEWVYKKCLKEYCGQIPNLNNDNRISPLSLEDLYTPLKICKGQLIGNNSVGMDQKGQQYIDTIIRQLDQQLAERLARVTQRNQAEVENPSTEKTNLDWGGISTVFARPGGGKTTWSKRVCLSCLTGDTDFFSKQLPLKKWHMCKGLFPIFLCCRNMTEIDNQDGKGFCSLAYKLIALSLGKMFSQNYSEQEFLELMNKHAADGTMLLIVDGWDELSDEQLEDHFEVVLKHFLEDNPTVKCVITTRPQQNKTELLDLDEDASTCGQQKTTKLLNMGDAYTIEALNSEDVRLFCKRWHEEMFRGDPRRIGNYQKVISQLESPYYTRISYMTETPYLLSNLLRCSQHYGRLPSGMAELYSIITDMMVEWFTKIDTGLEKHDVMIQLAYIAYAMTKKRKFAIAKTELCDLLNQCFHDLDGLFRCPLQEISIEQYLIHFLSRNCVLETTFGGLFHFPHREMQDYFSAVAIVNGYLDEEDNMRDPYDILKDHYTSSEQSERELWETIIVFSTLISGPRFSRSIIEDIITCAEEDDDNELNLRDLLFLFVLNNTDILKSDRLHIYEVCFARRISTKQISGIWQLAEQDEENYAEFLRFIKSEFEKSVEKGDLLYCFAWAIICAKQLVDEGADPLYEAEKYLVAGDQLYFATGISMLDVFSWCKYESVSGNEFSEYYCNEGFEISEDGCKAMRSALENHSLCDRDAFAVDIARTIYSCTLADFLRDSRIKKIVSEDFLSTLLNRETLSINNRKVLDYLSAVYPVPALEDIPTSSRRGSEQTREKYLHQFDSAWRRKSRDSLAFSFNRCLVMGVWKTEVEVKEQLLKLNHIRLDTPNQIRLIQIKKMLGFFSIRFETEKKSNYEIYVQRDQLSDENDQYVDHLSKINNVPEAIQVVIMNNIAYLVRRGELRCVRVDDYGRRLVKAEELLANGINKKEGFSSVNYALAISSFSKDSYGSYEVGLGYLQDHFSPSAKILCDIKLWWWRLAKERNELEGLIVLLWLFELGYIDFAEDASNENGLSIDDAEFLITYFSEKAEKLGNHCKNTMHLVNDSLRKNRNNQST